MQAGADTASDVRGESSDSPMEATHRGFRAPPAGQHGVSNHGLQEGDEVLEKPGRRADMDASTGRPDTVLGTRSVHQEVM
eukprot:766160-Hanusia_phi.AAC.2